MICDDERTTTLIDDRLLTTNGKPHVERYVGAAHDYRRQDSHIGFNRSLGEYTDCAPRPDNVRMLRHKCGGSEPDILVSISVTIDLDGWTLRVRDESGTD
jgi:hypothetical protein